MFLEMSVLDLLSRRIPEATGSPTVRWLWIRGKHNPARGPLHFQMIIKKNNQLINQSKNNQKIRVNLGWDDTFQCKKRFGHFFLTPRGWGFFDSISDMTLLIRPPNFFNKAENNKTNIFRKRRFCTFIWCNELIHVSYRKNMKNPER